MPRKDKPSFQSYSANVAAVCGSNHRFIVITARTYISVMVFNFNCVVLDGAKVTIGAGTLIGPAAQIYATGHPIESDERIFVERGIPSYRTNASPVSIGERVWVGGGAIILPGVSVGNGTTIGSGSVVTKSLPDNVFAAGNPCKVFRAL